MQPILQPEIGKLDRYFSCLTSAQKREDIFDHNYFLVHFPKNPDFNFREDLHDCHDMALGFNYYSQGGCTKDENGSYTIHSFMFLENQSGKTLDKIVEDYNYLLQIIAEANNLTTEDVGKAYELSSQNENNHIEYVVGNYFKKSLSLMYIPLKLFRMAMFKKETDKDLKSVIASFLTHTSRDRYVVSKYLDNLIMAYNNIEVFEKEIKNGFLSQIMHGDFKELVEKTEKNKMAKQKAQEQVIKAQEQVINELKKIYGRKKQAPISVFSRHPSHDALRDLSINWRVRIRLGSTTEKEDSKYKWIEINLPEGIRNSSSKIRMKTKFQEFGVVTAPWCCPKNENDLKAFLSEFKEGTKFVVKSEFGSRGEGNTLHETAQSVVDFMNRQERYGRYIVEKFMTYIKEYRIHVSDRGVCFYTCRKMLKGGTPKEDTWHRHDSNSVWIVEENPLFDKPATWNNIVNDCVKAIKAVGLDIGAVDVKVNKHGEWFIIETNSAPSFGDITLEKYQQEIIELTEYKIDSMIAEKINN